MPRKPAFAGRSRALNLRRDVDLYRGLTARVGLLPPTPFMLPFMGAAAEDLAKRRAPDAVCWRAFREDVSRLHPSLPVWTPTTAEDGEVLSSVVERIAYQALRSRLPACVALVVHPTITESRKWKADFALTRSGHQAPTYVEVAGLLAADWRPRTEREIGYKLHFKEKLAVYAEAGLPRPVIVHIDEVCDPNRLRVAVDAVVAQVGGLAA